MLHSTCDLQFFEQKAVMIECRHPVATAPGSVTTPSPRIMTSTQHLPVTRMLRSDRFIG
jgi:hypothetical protein